MLSLRVNIHSRPVLLRARRKIKVLTLFLLSGFSPSTLYCTRNKLQLVGVTAMFIASKHEEIHAPECRDFVYISDKADTREQILQMEGLILSGRIIFDFKL